MDRDSQVVAYVNDILHLEAPAMYRDSKSRRDETQPTWSATLPLIAQPQADGTCKVLCPVTCDSVVTATNPLDATDKDKFWVKVQPDILAENKPPKPDRLGLHIELIKVERIP